MPPGEVLDRVPYWMCAAMDRPRLNLYSVARVVRWLGDAFADREPWRLVTEIGGPWLQFEPWQLEAPTSHGWLVRALEARDRRGRAWRRGEHRGGLIARFFGDDPRWQELKELDARLHADLATA